MIEYKMTDLARVRARAHTLTRKHTRARLPYQTGTWGSPIAIITYNFSLVAPIYSPSILNEWKTDRKCKNQNFTSTIYFATQSDYRKQRARTKMCSYLRLPTQSSEPFRIINKNTKKLKTNRFFSDVVSFQIHTKFMFIPKKNTERKLMSFSLFWA